MSHFILDTTGDVELLKTDALKTTHNIVKAKLLAIDHLTDAGRSTSSNDEDITEEDLYGLPPPNVDVGDIIDSTLAITLRKPSKVEEAMDFCIERLACTSNHIKNKQKLRYLVDLDHWDFNETSGRHNDDQLIKTDVTKIMGKSSMVPGLEKLKDLPSVVNTRKQRELNKASFYIFAIQRSKTKGKDWFNMSAPETTEEVENDLKILKMRSVLDPKHFYKKNDFKGLPKYFQIGTVQYSALDDRDCDVRRNKKRSLVDELLADSEAQIYTKRKYNEIVKQKGNYANRKATKRMKKLKKNN
uniref:Fcf2 domain-containing protein n=1 Tax=Glossina pallidipes TaxID=7398 RepID=A0A1A9ZVZ8_GLOPL